MAKENNSYAWRNLDLSYLKSGIYYDEAKRINRLDILAQAFQAKIISVDNKNAIIKIVGEKKKDKTLIISNGNLLLNFDDEDNIEGIKVKEPNTTINNSLLMRVNSDTSNNGLLYLKDENNILIM